LTVRPLSWRSLEKGKTVTLTPWASAILVVGYIVLSLISVMAFAAIALVLSKLNARLEALTAKVDPLLGKADEILTVTNEKIASIGDKTEGILAHGEETAESVHEKVDRTAVAVQRTVHAPIIAMNSFAAGVSRGVSTFGRLQRRNGQAAATVSAAPPVEAERGTVFPASAAAESEVHTQRQQNGQTAREAIPIPAGREN